MDTPEPSGRYGYKESTARINDVAPPKKSPSRLLSGKQLDSQRKTDHGPPTQSQEESLKPDRPADKRLIRGESSDSISSGRQKAELPRDRQSATYTAKEWFEKGRAMDDESEAEIECYKKAIEIDPTFAPAYYCLGAIYFRQANYESAYEEFAEFLKCASEVDRQAYDIYVYCSPFDVERLSEEKLKGEAPAEEVKEEMPPKGETETPAAGYRYIHERIVTWNGSRALRISCIFASSLWMSPIRASHVWLLVQAPVVRQAVPTIS